MSTPNASIAAAAGAHDAAPRPIVIKIGGAGVDSPADQTPLWHAVLDAHRALDGALVLVHGGGRAVDAHLDRLGLTTTRVEGLRVTPPEHIHEIVAVLAGRVNKALVGAINAAARNTPHTPHHAAPRVSPHADDDAPHHRRARTTPAAHPAVGLCLGDANMLATAPLVLPSGADLGRVGAPAPRESSPDLPRTLMRAGFLPVVCSIGLDARGQPLNVNADDAAAGLAQTLDARALVLLTDVEAVLDEHKRPIPALDAATIESLIARGTISGGMVPKVRAALAAARAARIPATIASWNRPHDLLRLAQGEAIGTRITPD